MKKLFGLIVSGLFLSFAASAQTPSSEDTSVNTNSDSMGSENHPTKSMMSKDKSDEKQKMEDSESLEETKKRSGSTSPSTEEDTSGY